MAGTLPLPLRASTLSSLDPRVALPSYDRRALLPAIVHVGVGGFHRAHQAVYLDDIAERGVSADWGECGIGLLPGDARMADALQPQDCLYTVVERDASGDRARVIGALSAYIHAPADPARALALLCDPATRIVSLTITEGGYLVDDATGEFAADHPDVRADLAQPDAPRRVFGYLATALARRRAAGIAPFTVLSCDNLPGNGEVARTALTAFARLRDPDLAGWIDASVAFPNSMVDRITPQTTDADRALLAERFGIADAWPVVCEPFRQWVLEDHFCNGRPPLDEAGVKLVTDVAPYELMKLRLLNGSHQALAYLGLLAGHHYVHEALADPTFQRFIARLMADEVAPLLPPAPGIDLVVYQRTLVERFKNPNIADTLERLATDGADRMPKFVLPSLREALAAGRPHRLLTLVVAGYIRSLREVDDRGQRIDVLDPHADELRRRARGGIADPRPLLAVRAVFGNLGDDALWTHELSRALRELGARGVHGAIEAALDGRSGES